MKCKKCNVKLEILRLCSKVMVQCNVCGRRYHIHEVADQLTAEFEEILSHYPTIIYD